MNNNVQTWIIIRFTLLYVKYNTLNMVKLININQVSTTKTHLSVVDGQNVHSCSYYNTKND
jgi:hypothetical protein